MSEDQSKEALRVLEQSFGDRVKQSPDRGEGLEPRARSRPSSR